MKWLVLILWLLGVPAQACKLALALGTDVSQSIDFREYAIQRDGLAAALLDPEISAALVKSQAMVTVIQWAGAADQHITIPWVQIREIGDVDALALEVRAMERAFLISDTGIGAALNLIVPQFGAVSACKRRVIDMSGDGRNNSGLMPEGPRQSALASNITINGLAIDGGERGIADYYRREVIGGPGAFVIEADGFRDYPRAIRLKLLREISEPVS